MHDDRTTSENYIRKLLNVPDHVNVESIIAIGCPAETREPLPRENLKDEKIRMNVY
jgi:hypothetical protein